MAIFISPEEEEFIVARQHIVLVVAMTLDIVSLALLIKHTPSLMAEFRKYLYLIQASCSIRNQGTWTILGDIACYGRSHGSALPPDTTFSRTSGILCRAALQMGSADPENDRESTSLFISHLSALYDLAVSSYR